MKTAFFIFLFTTSIIYSQTTEIYVPDVDGTEYDGQLVKVWDANSGEYYGEQQTTNSLAVFDNITSVQVDPINYQLSAGYNPVNNSVYFTSSKSGKVAVILSDILGQSRKVETYVAAGRGEIKLDELGLNNFANGFYALQIITPTESYSLGFMKNGLNYSATSVVKQIKGRELKKTNITDEIRVEVTHTDHYTRTFIAEKSERVEDYVVGYVEQMKTDNTPVTPEEFKQYCWDFNFIPHGDGTADGFKSFFPNENKEIWIAMSDKNDPSITFEYTQMEQIRDLVIDEIYPYIEASNQPSFYLQSSVNPDEIPLYETGKIVIMPKPAGYSFGAQGDGETGIITSAYARLDDDLDIPNNVGQSRSGTLEEVASCLFGPRDSQGPPYGIYGVKTILVGGEKMYPIDIKLCQMAQKLSPKTQLDDVLGL